MSGATVDRGSASIWVVCCCALLIVVTSVAVLRTEAVLVRHRAESAADLAALAAAGRIGIAGDECTSATRTAAANGGELRECRPAVAADGRSGAVAVRVVVRVRLPLVGVREVVASARAGRDPVPP